MTLKHFFIFLAVTSSVLATMPEVWALRPRDDLFVHVLNSTNHPLEICNSELTFCRKVSFGEVMTDAQATENHAMEYFGFWLDHSVAKLCGKIVPLKNIVLTPVEEKGWWGRVTYRLTVPEEGYLRECKGVSSNESSN